MTLPKQPGLPNSTDTHTFSDKFANELHQNMWNNVVYAEQKAAFIFVSVSGVLVYLNQSGGVKAWLISPSLWGRMHYLAFASTTCLLISIAMVVMVVIPRFPKASQGLFYWRAIAETPTSAEYVSRYSTETDRKLQEALVAHSYQLACVAKKKYVWLRISLLVGCCGALLSGLFVAVYKH